MKTSGLSKKKEVVADQLIYDYFKDIFNESLYSMWAYQHFALNTAARMYFDALLARNDKLKKAIREHLTARAVLWT